MITVSQFAHVLSQIRTVIGLILTAIAVAEPAHWERHIIDDTSQGADGVRLGDFNGDRLPDIVTGWEEGRVVRVYRNPGPAAVKQRWPAQTLATVPAVEDAVFVDLDGDRLMDVVSASEGKRRSLQVHWSPDWKTRRIPSSIGMMQWMFTAPLQIDGRAGIDLISGGKGEGAALGWWESPPNPRDLKSWRWHEWRPLGWLMSILTRDMDGDGDADVLFSDRKGSRSGTFWLELPSATEHLIGAAGREVMFISHVDLDGDGLEDVLSAVKPREIHWHRRLSRDGRKWQTTVIPMPASTGTAKAVRAADLDGDGSFEIVFSCEQTPAGASGVMGMRLQEGEWKAFPISGSPGIKYDLIELLDLDGDGDLDVITCEEASNLGVVWFENPAR